MADAITIQALQDASLDAKSLEEVVNGDDTKQVTTRLGETYPSVKKAIKTLFENGGLPATPFATKALMTASALVDGAYAQVTDGGADNGLYVKEAGAWVKSTYDPVTLSKSYSDNKSAESLEKSKGFTLLNKKESSDVVEYSTNLFDHTKEIRGKSISEYGNLVDNTSFSVSPYAAVEPNSEYTISGGDFEKGINPLQLTAYYDADKIFISRISSNTDASNSLTITTPDNAYYVRFAYGAGGGAMQKRMFNKGSTALPYEPYYVRLKNDVIINAKNQEQQIIRPSINLYNPATVTKGKIISAQGNITDNEYYAITDFIKVKSGETYRLSSHDGNIELGAFTSVAFYNELGGFINRADINKTPTSDNRHMEIPDGAGFIRLNINLGVLSSIEEGKRMVSLGANDSEYEPYTPLLDNIRIPRKITEESLSRYIKPSANLLDLNDFTKGIAINVHGSIVTAEHSHLSDYIPVKTGKDYVIWGGVKSAGKLPVASIAFFNADKEFISRQNYSAGTEIAANQDDVYAYTFKIPEEVYYVRLNTNAGAPNDIIRMFHEGDRVIPYEPMLPTLDNMVLSDRIVEQVKGSDNNITNGKQYTYDLPVNGVFNSTRTTWAEDYTDFRSITAAAVYAMYDDLMSRHPDYITKEFLGNDGLGNPISLYKFKPKDVVSDNPKKMPKIFLTLGTHGYEHLPPLCTYLLLQEMCENYEDNEQLEALRFNMELLVIPVVNPSGWDAFHRTNHNIVDINRNTNAESGWTKGTPTPDNPYSTYGGPSEFSELESQYIKGVIDNHLDIIAYYDFHNFAGTSDTKNYIWIPTANIATELMSQNLVSRMERKFKKEYSWIQQDWNCGYTEVLGKNGMLMHYANSVGIPFAATFEIGEKWWIKPDAVIYDDLHCKTMVETLGNFLLLNLKAVGE